VAKGSRTRADAPGLALVLCCAALLTAGCQFEPEIEPLIIPTAPGVPLSPFSTTAAPMDSLPSGEYAPPSPDVTTHPSRISRLDRLWAQVTAILASVTAALVALLLQFIRRDARPPIGVLIVVGVLLSIVILLVDLLFVAAEVILAGPDFAGNPLTILLSLIVVILGLFLINLDVAYWVYVYRLAGASPSEEVPFDLTPFDWGLRQNE